ncbi:putative three-domain protein adenylation-thiolation-dehydrogenase [Mycena venus]|uniref:Putative three-domain protein adenylation-thiolation-dehydrogenase n=1 Tax=Mycena venus TaxID=2733690 RepID=A0A8H6YVS8_9AGAR|nr:putative three-domain protein adenylation-thiolation-dehydrogenase [Mycena venus]
MQASLALDTLTEIDKLRFSLFGCGPTVFPPFQCVHHAFHFHSSNNPDKIAVQDALTTITFAQLNQKSNCLASRLRGENIGPGSRVCLLVERSISMVIGILGILKAGAAYVPCDGKVVSDSHLKHILKDSESKVVITLGKFSHRVSDLTVPVILLDHLCVCFPETRCPQPEDQSSPRDSVYVIYTSGTTGVPKGDVQHQNVTNLVCVAPGNLGMGPGVRVSQLMNISFDMAAWEILGSLCNGATLVLRGQTSKEWRAAMKTVDIVIGTPSMLAPHDPVDYPNIKTVAVAGEACPRALADSWAQYTQFYNCCGPTEVTIVNTMHLHYPGRSLSIGRPTPNNRVYILDDCMNPTPIGVPGIMWAGGQCVTRGYLNLSDKTNERYRRDPFVNDGSRMFKTGDLGSWRLDGTLEHLGRIDDQVKIKGFRVELDGVAVAMETASGVKAATALSIDGELWGFVTPDSVSVEQVRKTTTEIQPYYAVPTHIIALENDKTDKRALRHMVMDFKNAGVDSVSEKVLPCSPSGIPNTNAPMSLDDSASSIELKKSEAWDGYEQDPLPNKLEGRIVRNLRHQIFTLYRRLFGIVFVTNVTIAIVLLSRGANTQHLGLITLANLFVAILIRQEYVVNVFFNVFCAVPTSWSLSIRRVCARVYHIGGLHSGCAISGVIWLALLCAQATKEAAEGGDVSHASVATVFVSYSIFLLLVGIAIFAHPSLRSKRHDSFECVHRYFGWSSIILVWVQAVALTNDYRGEQSLFYDLVTSGPFWMLVIMTGSIILPWLQLKEVPVRSEVLSKHAVRLYFTYCTPKPGSFVRLATHPLKDWHGFATIPVPNEKGFSLVISKAGDWTTARIMEPPSTIWVRGTPCFGVLRIVPLFQRVVLVATGSGIGPCAPCLFAQRVPIRLLWTSPDVRETFGDTLVSQILDASPDAVIYDTRKHGKPDMVKLTLRLVAEFKAEAVCIISNQKLTQKVVYGMMSRGIPAFGAIWDS